MFSDKQHKVGVIGLGIIGSRVAEQLREADAHVYVWNRSPRTEPNFLSSPAEIAQLADVIQIFVTNGEALMEIVEAMLPKLTKKHVVLNHSTVDLISTKKAGSLIAEKEAAFLDAPFTGSRDAAAKGALVYYVGGDEKVLERVRPVLEVSAKEILPVGSVGEATVLKIATNMISATVVEVLSESYALTSAHGVEPEKLQLALENNACGSVLTGMKLPGMIAGDFEPHFSLKNMFKDAQLALGLANDKKLDMPALSTTASIMFKTMQKDKNNGELDYSVLAKNYEGKLKKETPEESDAKPEKEETASKDKAKTENG